MDAVMLAVLLWLAWVLVLASAWAAWRHWLRAVLRLGPDVAREWHHVYLGVPLVFAPPTWGWWVVLAWAAGLWVMWDDAWQHEQQRWNPAYRSPLHRAAHWLHLI